MMIGHSSGTLFDSLIPSGLRLGLTMIIVFMVISSPIVMLVNPALKAAPSSAEDYASLSTPSTISQDGVSSTGSGSGNGEEGKEFTTQAALSSVTAKQSNNIVNTRSYYDITFTTASGGSIKDIIIDFPTGTAIGTSGLLVESEGIGAGTAAKTGPLQITYTVTDPVLIPAGTTIRLELSTIDNPPAGASYKVTVTTKRPAGTPIDGPTPSGAYKINQIGTEQIADNAVTGSKIAGTDKLIFGTCTGALPSLVPGGSGDFNCSDSNAADGDEMVVTWSNVRSSPSPVLINSIVAAGAVAFGFENPSSVATSPQSAVRVSYILFKTL